MKETLVQLTKWAATDRPRYESEIRVFYGRLWDTWERAVEENLVNNAIRRFSDEVYTRSLKRLYNVTEAQLNDLEAGMTKTSTLAHDHSPELGLPVPEPAEAAADLAALEAWARDMKKLHDQA